MMQASILSNNNVLQDQLTTYDSWRIGTLSNSDTPKLVCLHGWLSNKYIYGPLLTKLKGKVPAIAIDLPGFGNTGKSHVKKFAGHYLEYLDQVLSILGKQFDLMGTSLGASLSLLYAQKYPAKVNKLILRVPYLNNQQFKVLPISLLHKMFKLSELPIILELMRLPITTIYKRINRPATKDHLATIFYQKCLQLLPKQDPKIAKNIIEWLFAHDLTPDFQNNSKQTLLQISKQDELFNNNLSKVITAPNYKLSFTKSHSLLRCDSDKLAAEVAQFLL